MASFEIRYVMEKVGRSTKVARKRLIFGMTPDNGQSFQDRDLSFVVSSSHETCEKGFNVTLITVRLPEGAEPLTREDLAKRGWTFEEEIVPTFCTKDEQRSEDGT